MSFIEGSTVNLIIPSVSASILCCRHCGILYIKSDCSFKLVPVALRTVRPFILDSVSLSDTGIHPQDNDEVESFLTNKVTELVEEARKRGTNDKLPLVRLKVGFFIVMSNERE